MRNYQPNIINQSSYELFTLNKYMNKKNNRLVLS